MTPPNNPKVYFDGSLYYFGHEGRDKIQKKCYDLVASSWIMLDMIRESQTLGHVSNGEKGAAYGDIWKIQSLGSLSYLTIASPAEITIEDSLYIVAIIESTQKLKSS